MVMCYDTRGCGSGFPRLSYFFLCTFHACKSNIIKLGTIFGWCLVIANMTILLLFSPVLYNASFTHSNINLNVFSLQVQLVYCLHTRKKLLSVLYEWYLLQGLPWGFFLPYCLRLRFSYGLQQLQLLQCLSHTPF